MPRQSPATIEVYLESGTHRSLAAALDWPGWCRAGCDEAAALQGLLAAGPRYARVLRSAKLGFQAPGDISALIVTERRKGNAATDFGVPNLVPARDTRPVADLEVRRLQAVLKACWRAWDAAVELAQGKVLRTGPRGGGRTLAGIVEHVCGAELGYFSRLGGKVPAPEASSASRKPVRQAILTTLTASAHGEIASLGPRGGKRWPPSYFVRRAAWHILDHVWEIEDRLEEHAA